MANNWDEFKKRAAREPEKPNPDQLRLPGFAGGGLISKYLHKAKTFRDRLDILRDYRNNPEELLGTFLRPQPEKKIQVAHFSPEPNLVLRPSYQSTVPAHDLPGIYSIPNTPKHLNALADAGWSAPELSKYVFELNAAEHPVLDSSLANRYFYSETGGDARLLEPIWEALLADPTLAGIKRLPRAAAWGPSVGFSEYITGKPDRLIPVKKAKGGLAQYKECTCGK